MIKNQQVDGFGSGIQQRIFPTGAAYVTSSMIPPFGEPWPVQPFVQSLTSSSGSTDMRVVGTLAAPIEFVINASTSADRFITALSFAISDDNPQLNQFGALTALTNGCLLLYKTPNSTVQVLPSLKTNFDFVRMGFGSPSIGADATAFRAGSAFGTNSEVYTPTIRFVDWLPPFGLKLDINSGNQLVFQVRDTTTGIDAFNAIAFGFDRVPEKHQKPITIKVT